MKTPGSMQTPAPIALIILALAGVFLLSGSIERNRPPVPVGYEDEDLVFQGAKLKGFSLGLNGAIADWYWMQSLQYLGGKLAKKPDVKVNVNDLRKFDPKLLYPLLDNAVSFDPQFIGAYEYGAIVLPAIDPNLAIKIVMKGIENNPNEWRLYNHLGYIYWLGGEYEKAAEAYQKASAIDGASPLMKAMAARMKSDGGSRDTARSIYTQMFNEAKDTNSKQTAELFLLRIDALDEIDAMNNALAEFRRTKGRCASDLSEVIPLLNGVKLPNGKEFRIRNDRRPVDPTGAPYFLDTKNCFASLDAQNTKLPLN